MKLVACLSVLFCSPAFASDSAVLTPNALTFFDLPASPAFLNPGSVRMEMRIHNWSVPSTRTLIFSIGGLSVQLSPENDGTLVVTDWTDTFTRGFGNAVFLKMSGYPDAVIRIQRDITTQNFSASLRRIDGSGYAISSIPIDGVERKSWAGSSTIGGPFTSARLGYLRMFSNLLPTDAAFSLNRGGDLLQFEFDSGFPDDSARSLRLPNIPLAPTPVYPPGCNIRAPKSTFRAGSDVPLDGSRSIALNGSPSLQYQWSIADAPEPGIAWSAPVNLPETAFRPSVFGTYSVQLRVTDSSRQSTSCLLKIGSVVTDDNDIIQFSDPNLGTLFGPLVSLGSAPWPWYDERHQFMADFFGALQATDFTDPWNQPLSGTLALTSGSPIITGTATTFQKDLCNGSTQSTEYTLVLWYPRADGTTGRRPYGIRSCDSDTQITLTEPYRPPAPSASSLSSSQYARMSNLEVYNWINGSTNANYYDNVLAFYALYYRSGIDTYRDYARTLADRWWTQPWIDEGLSCADGATCLFPRLRSMTGLVVRALDGRPEMWSGLRTWCSTLDRYYLNLRGPVSDLREQSHQLNEVALCALFDPDLTLRDQYRADLIAALDGIWEPHQQPQGHWLNATFGLTPWNGQPGTITVTHGSPLVEGVGTSWTAAQIFADAPFWVAAAPNDAWIGDPAFYQASFIDSTHLRLDRPYEGESASGRGWQVNNLLGPGTQPFVMGVAANAFNLVYQATGDPRARDFIIDIAKWLRDYGYRSSVRGLYYGRYFVNCEPIRENLPNCSADPPFAARVYAGEVLNAFALAYSYSRDPSFLEMGDSLFGALFGKLGGPQTDDEYNREIDTGGWTFVVKRAKDFGFLYGSGQSWRWTGVRLEFSRGNHGSRPGSTPRQDP